MRNSYSVSGSLERNLAAIDVMDEKAAEGEKALCVHNCDFGDYNGAFLYAARTPLEEVDTEAAYGNGFDVARRSTGGSPYLWREEDIILTATSTSGDILEECLGPAVKNALESYGVDEERIDIKSGSSRRAVWIDEMPISSFGSYASKNGEVLSGFIAATPYDSDRISEVMRLRKGEKEYIDQMPAVSDFTDDLEGFSDLLLSEINTRETESENWETLLEEYATNYENGVEDRKGNSHRGFCPVFRDDLEEFRQSLQLSQ